MVIKIGNPIETDANFFVAVNLAATTGSLMAIWKPATIIDKYTICGTSSRSIRCGCSRKDHGSWRRLVLLTFPYRYVRSEAKIEAENDRVGDIGLRQRLKGEPQKEAFLAWVIEGARKYLERGSERPLEMTSRMQADWEDWRGNSDPLGRFLGDMLEFDPTSCVASGDLFEEFKLWLTANGHPAWSSQLLTARLEGHHAAMAHNVKRSKVRAGADSGLSLRPGPVQVEYKDGQQVRAWKGLRWRKDPM